MAVTTQQEYGVVFFLPIETFGVDVVPGHRFVLFAFGANSTHQRLVCVHQPTPACLFLECASEPRTHSQCSNDAFSACVVHALNAELRPDSNLGQSTRRKAFLPLLWHSCFRPRDATPCGNPSSRRICSWERLFHRD